jgi:hypothetical protein
MKNRFCSQYKEWVSWIEIKKYKKQRKIRDESKG